MSIAYHLLKCLNTIERYHGHYKRLRRKLSGYSDEYEELRQVKDQTLHNTLYRLKKRDLVKNIKGEWHITIEGKQYLEKTKKQLKIFKPKKSHAPRTTRKIICIFDIPEHIRFKRDWLREQLDALGFNLLQQSVWIGPAPIPKTFVSYLREIDVLEHVKFFEAHEKDIM
jgi:DNA-binding transcriptional regulator PaaX